MVMNKKLLTIYLLVSASFAFGMEVDDSMDPITIALNSLGVDLSNFDVDKIREGACWVGCLPEYERNIVNEAIMKVANSKFGFDEKEEEESGFFESSELDFMSFMAERIRDHNWRVYDGGISHKLCPVCGMQVKSTSNAHIYDHFGPFICPVEDCDSVRSANRMYRHARIEHGVYFTFDKKLGVFKINR